MPAQQSFSPNLICIHRRARGDRRCAWHVEYRKRIRQRVHTEFFESPKGEKRLGRGSSSQRSLDDVAGRWLTPSARSTLLLRAHAEPRTSLAEIIPHLLCEAPKAISV